MSNPGDKDACSFAGRIFPNGSETGYFYWYFPSTNKTAVPSETPVIFWINSGPGESVLVPIFLENGPLQIDENMNLS